MKVIVLGAGVIGTASAWYLARRPATRWPSSTAATGAGLETSFANGGQVSVCHAEPWANPGAPLKVLRWLSREDAPLLFRLRMDPRSGRGGCASSSSARAWRTRENIAQILAMAFYSRKALQELRAGTGIAYDESDARHPALLHRPRRASRPPARPPPSCAATASTASSEAVEEAVAIEPALAPAASADRRAPPTRPPTSPATPTSSRPRSRGSPQAKGAQFLCDREIRGLRATQKGVSGVVVAGPGGEETIAGDAFVVALGSYSAAAHAPARGSRCRSIPPRATRRPCPWPIRTRRRASASPTTRPRS